MIYDVLVIGAGQAGLAAGYYLQQTGYRFALLEQKEQIAGSWPHYYESLTLFSPARFSSLPGLPFPGEPEHYPHRDEVSDYLQRYAHSFQLPVIMQAQVKRIEREEVLFSVHTTTGENYSARSIIAATGAFSHPYIPQLLGQDRFAGQILHSATYRHPEPFRGQRVLVVGAGNSAVQIGVELAQVAHVTLSSRRPIKFLPQCIGGRDIHFWAWLTGLDRLPLGSFWAQVPPGVLDMGAYQAAFAEGKLDRRTLFRQLTPEGVIWQDGCQEAIDGLIFATGYRPNLSYLDGLSALDPQGQALQRAGISLTTPGLYYLGLEWQRTFASATIRGVGSDADVIIKELRRYLHAVRSF